MTAIAVCCAIVAAAVAAIILGSLRFARWLLQSEAPPPPPPNPNDVWEQHALRLEARGRSEQLERYWGLAAESFRKADEVRRTRGRR